MKCRHCGAQVSLSLVDLGAAPPSNAYLTQERLQEPEKWFPLKVLVCEKCWLVQTQDFSKASELFDAEYAYFSGFSKSWLQHCEKYVNNMIEAYGLTSNSYVMEVASNDGSLLQYVKAKGIACLGVEPTKSTADAARLKGIEVVEEFFGVELATKLAKENKQFDLTAANNVLAHVPDINDFVSGFRIVLKPDGVATFEFPHLLNLIKETQFDTIYHEHFSYLSLTAVKKIFSSNGLTIFDVEELSTHGGSLRVHAQRTDTGKRPTSKNVARILDTEDKAGISTREFYEGFQAKCEKVKDDLVEFLINVKKSGKKVIGYGAAAKGNTLMNFAGLRSDLVSMVIDLNPSKQNKFLPGSRIPIVGDDVLKKLRPEFVLILPWNLKAEIIQQLSFIREWDGKFVVAVPELKIL